MSPIPTLRLVDTEGSELIVLRPADPSGEDVIACSTFSVGAPAARENVQERAGMDGDIDLTRYHGGRTFTADLFIRSNTFTNKETVLESLEGICHPEHRFYVYLQRDHWAQERRMLVRGNPFAVVSNRAAANGFNASISLACPSGTLEAATAASGLVRPMTATAGLSFPLNWVSTVDVALSPVGGVAFDPGTSSNLVSVVNEGNAPTPARFRIYGRATNPVIINRTLKQRIAFKNLTVDTGSVLDVDVDSKSALLNYSATQSQYGYIDWSVSSWFRLAAGSNEIVFEATNTDADTELVIDWRSRWV